MGVSVNTIRKVTIQGEAPGVDAAAASVRGLNAAVSQSATVTDVATRRQLSINDAYQRQTRALDSTAAATAKYARELRTLEAAQAQGVIKSSGEYYNRLTALQQRYGQTGEAAKTLTAHTTKLSNAFSMANGALATMGVAVGIGAMVAFGKSVLSTTADLQEQTDQILGAGGNVEALQALRGLFLQNGIEMGQGDKILARLNRTLGEAAEGSKTAQDAFKKLNLGAKDLAGVSADAALPLIAKRLLEVGDGSKRAAIEAAIFGRTGQQLESALTSLAAGGMADIVAQAKDMGIVIDRDMINKADKAKDRMGLSFLKIQTALAPLVSDWASGFASMAEGVDGASSKLETLAKNLAIVASVYAGAKLGALFGPGGALVGAVGGGIAGVKMFGGTPVEQQIANYNTKLADPNLGSADRKYTEYLRSQLYTMLPKVELYKGPYTLGPAANDDGGKSGWAPTKDDLKNTEKFISYRRELLPLDKEIAEAAEKAAAAGTKQIENAAELEQSLDQYIFGLEQEVKYAGLAADERERQEAVMQGIRVSQGRITDEQKRTIVGAVSLRQEIQLWRGVADDFTDGMRNGIESILTKGKEGFGDLWNNIKQGFVRLLSYLATQALVQPIILPVVTSLAGAFGGSGAESLVANMFGGMSGGGASISNMLSFGSQASSIFDFASGGSTTSSIFGGIGSKLTSGLDWLGGKLGLGAGGLGNLLGGAGIAGVVGNLMGGNSFVSSGLGIAGSMIGGPIGALAGGVLGGLVGNFGASNQGAISNFTNDGLGNTLFKAGGGNNGAMATQATGSINATIQALRDAGIAVGLGNISGLSIGSDKSYVYDFAGGKQKLAGGEAGIQETVNAILTRILPGASGTTTEAQDVLTRYGGLNAGNVQQVLTDLQQAKQEAEALAQATQAFNDAISNLTVGKSSLSEGAAAIKAINDQIDPLVAKALELGQSTEKLEQLRSQGIDALRVAANDNIATALKAITDPIGLQVDQLLETQRQRLQSARDLGANVSAVYALNDAEISEMVSTLKAGFLTDGAAVANARAGLEAAYSGEASALQSRIDALSASGANLRSYQGRLAVVGLSDAGAYAASRAKFASAASLAAGGDLDAQGSLSELGDAFLSASAAGAKSRSQFIRDRALVSGAVGAAASSAEQQAAAAVQQLDALNQSVEALLELNKTTVSVKDAIGTMQTALSEQQQKTADNTAKLTNLLNQLSEGGKALRTVAG